MACQTGSNQSKFFMRVGVRKIVEKNAGVEFNDII